MGKNEKTRTKQALNFGWRYKEDFDQKYIEKGYSVKDWTKADLPHTNKILPFNNFDEKEYQFESCYVLDFTPTKDIPPRVLLEFEGVMCYAIVYLNGKEIGSHKGGYTPFNFDVSKLIEREKENRIVVYVDSSERSEIPPFGFVVDYLTYGGIYREVNLLATEEMAIDDVFIKTQKIKNDEKNKEQWAIYAEIELTQESKDDDQLLFELVSFDKNENSKDDKPILEHNHQLTPGQKKVLIDFPVPNILVSDILPWSPDSPNLYQLRTSLIRKDQSSHTGDTRIDRFGFRTVEMGVNGLKINGEAIKIRGLNRHQSFPYTGYAMPSSAQYQDAYILKEELGVNTVRSSHYPPSRHFLDACDELGLLVFNEIPGWQHIGEGEWHEITKQHVKEMIIRDRNHPSVFIWGVRINESHDNDKLYKATAEIARSLDDTRPLGGVRNFSKSKMFEDVYTYNDFVHTGNNIALEKPKKISGGNYPYLVTEHNGHVYPTKKIDQEDRKVEQAYRHLRVLNAAYKDKKHSGAIGWCMFDYNTHKDFGSGDKICYHGVMDMFRQPKIAAASYASQQDIKPYGYVTSSMQMGEMNNSTQGVVAVMTNSDFVKFYKNDTLIGTFYPDQKEFRHLPHPPVLIDDFIGDQILQEGRFSKQDAKSMKRVFKQLSLGIKPKAIHYMALGLTMLKNRLKFRDGYDLFLKYVGNWGVKSMTYKFEGYKTDPAGKDKKEWTITKGAASKSKLILIPDSAKIVEKNSWECVRISVKCVDEYGHDRLLAFDPLEIKVSGEAELIGPDKISLISGSTAFWIKSKGLSGDVNVSVTSPYFEKINTVIPIIGIK